MRIHSVAASVAVALWATRGSEQSSPLRFPQGSGYNIRVREYPKLPPRLRWIFADNPLFFVTLCTYERRKVLATDGAWGLRNVRNKRVFRS
jgi:hypothetical protein